MEARPLLHIDHIFRSINYSATLQPMYQSTQIQTRDHGHMDLAIEQWEPLRPVAFDGQEPPEELKELIKKHGFNDTKMEGARGNDQGHPSLDLAGQLMTWRPVIGL